MIRDELTRRLAEMDQNAKVIADSIPSLIRMLYKGFIEQGFTVDQSFRLVRDYMIAMCNGTVSPDDPES